MKTTLYLGIILLLLTGCYSNVSYVDLTTQQLLPCSGNTLTRVIITSKSPAYEIYDFYWNGQGPVPTAFTLSGPYTGFVVEGAGKDSANARVHLKLRPLTEYILDNHTHGDATSFEVTIQTDATGKVVKADRTSCD